MIHPKDKLSPEEETELGDFLKNLSPTQGRSGTPLIVAMVGLVGSGKSSIAKALATALDANVVEGDAIRAHFGYPHPDGRDLTRLVAEMCVVELVRAGNIVVVDSDFVDPNKRASLLLKAEGLNARVVFVRTVCEHNTAIARIRNATYPP